MNPAPPVMMIFIFLDHLTISILGGFRPVRQPKWKGRNRSPVSLCPAIRIHAAIWMRSSKGISLAGICGGLAPAVCVIRYQDFISQGAARRHTLEGYGLPVRGTKELWPVELDERRLRVSSAKAGPKAAAILSHSPGGQGADASRIKKSTYSG